MSDDIVYRLRNPNHWLFQIVGPKSGATVQGESDAPREAADEIERLRAELAACEADGERLVELSQANVRRLETAKAERDALRANLRDELERADAWHETFLQTQKHNEELRELLREARSSVGHQWELARRIDAALNKGGGEG